MYLHIRLRPDGNGTIYTGTPEELKKRYAAIRRRWNDYNPVPFETSHSVEVAETGSRYYIHVSERGQYKYHVCQHGEWYELSCLYCYESFAAAVNRLCKLMAAETET